MEEKKKAGRPKKLYTLMQEGTGFEDSDTGTKNVLELISRCPSCGSGERKIYYSNPLPTTPIKIGDKTYEGCVIRRNKCLKCGQNYISRCALEE